MTKQDIYDVIIKEICEHLDYNQPNIPHKAGKTVRKITEKVWASLNKSAKPVEELFNMDDEDNDSLAVILEIET